MTQDVGYSSRREASLEGRLGVRDTPLPIFEGRRHEDKESSRTCGT